MPCALIADDRLDSAERLAREVAAEGYQVVLASSGDEVLELVRIHEPDVVFLAPALPIYDGYETCMALRADPDSPAGLPIILLAERDFDPRRAERAGFTAVISRESAAADLRERLTGWIPY
ncbi:MAG TPA: response regulator [Candidatus Hydrogenedentes bacterium]|nr:response regulator [Candidatus Hydrogenedentota bacterium]